MIERAARYGCGHRCRWPSGWVNAAPVAFPPNRVGAAIPASPRPTLARTRRHQDDGFVHARFAAGTAGGGWHDGLQIRWKSPTRRIRPPPRGPPEKLPNYTPRQGGDPRDGGTVRRPGRSGRPAMAAGVGGGSPGWLAYPSPEVAFGPISRNSRIPWRGGGGQKLLAILPICDRSTFVPFGQVVQFVLCAQRLCETQSRQRR